MVGLVYMYWIRLVEDLAKIPHILRIGQKLGHEFSSFGLAIVS